MLDRILVPLDGSEAAASILPQVRRILLRRDAEVLLVRALELPPSAEAGLGGVADLQEARAQAETVRVERALLEQGARVRSLLRPGPPADVILGTAEQERASMIAMSTHGRTGIARWAFGSVTEKVLRASPIPVLALRSFEGSAPAPAGELALKRILIAVDAADFSLEVVPPAIELAKLFGSSVLLLHVCEGQPACSVPVPQLTRAFERFREAGVCAEPAMRVGDPASSILDCCRESGVELIALTTHGRSGVTRWMLGSVAEKILRGATVPLLLVRGGQGA
jgi:nucleotide-binding universal stress UspA family protein